MDVWLYLQDAAQSTAQPAAEGGGGSAFSTIIPLVIVVFLFYFIMIRPQMKQQKEKDAMLKGIKKNDHVLTQGGIYGIVHSVKDHDVVLTVDEKRDVKLRVARSAIVSIEKVAGGGSEKPEAEKQEAAK